MVTQIEKSSHSEANSFSTVSKNVFKFVDHKRRRIQEVAGNSAIEVKQFFQEAIFAVPALRLLTSEGTSRWCQERMVLLMQEAINKRNINKPPYDQKFWRQAWQVGKWRAMARSEAIRYDSISGALPDILSRKYEDFARYYVSLNLESVLSAKDENVNEFYRDLSDPLPLRFLKSEAPKMELSTYQVKPYLAGTVAAVAEMEQKYEQQFAESQAQSEPDSKEPVPRRFLKRLRKNLLAEIKDLELDREKAISIPLVVDDSVCLKISPSDQKNRFIVTIDITDDGGSLKKVGLLQAKALVKLMQAAY